MRSIGRDKELDQVLAQIARRVDARGELITSPGATSVGSQVHISVEAPPRGGLSLFLNDVQETLKERPGLHPVLVTMRDSAKPQEALRRAFEDIAQTAGIATPPDTTNLSLFQLCEELWERKNRVAVLMLDVTEALDQLHGNETLRRSAPANPLLQRLRILVNDMEDKQPKLVTIVGWRSDFRERSIEWKAQDVEMRYYPHITLWPDFQRDDAWPLFESILRANGAQEIDGQYPGFCRTGLTVGDIIEQMKQTGTRRIDGQLLLSTLVKKKPLEADAAAIPSELLVALCLQDATIGPAHPLYDKIPVPAVKPFVNPEKNAGQVSYVANEDLYQATHILPNRFRISIVRDYQRRFEVREPGFAVELLAGLPLALNVTAKEAPQDLGGYAKVEFDLPAEFVPAGLKEMRVTAYCTLAAEISNDLKTDVVARLSAIESSSRTRATECVLLLHSEAGLNNQLHAAALFVSPSKPDWRILEPKMRNAKEKVAALCTVDINSDQAIELAFKQVDPARQSKELLSHLQRRIKSHFNALVDEFPALESQYFEGQHLPRLMIESHTVVDLSNSGDDVSEATLKALEQLGVVQREAKKEVRWSFQEDALLSNMLELSECAPKALGDEMSKRYTFDPRSWPAIAAALASTYSDFLQFDGGTLRARPPETALTTRVRNAFTRLEPMLQEMKDLSVQSRAISLEKEREGLEARLNTARDIFSIETVCKEALALLEKGRKVVADTRESRDKLREQLEVSLGSLEKAPDASLSGLRAELLKRGKQVLANQLPLLCDLETIQRDLDSYRSKVRDSAEKLQTNVQDAVRLRKQLDERRADLNQLVAKAETLPQDDRLQESLTSIRQMLEDVERQLGDEKKHPGVTPDEREKELLGIRTTLAALATSFLELNKRLQTLRKPPSLVPDKPGPAVTRVSPQPASGGMMPPQPPAPSTPAPVSSTPAPASNRDDTHRTETPVVSSVAPQGSGPLGQSPQPPAGTPLGGESAAPVTPVHPEPPGSPAAVAPASLSGSSRQAAQLENVPSPAYPVPQPLPLPPVQTVQRTFLNTPESLRELSEFLDTQPRIVGFSFESPQS